MPDVFDNISSNLMLEMYGTSDEDELTEEQFEEFSEIKENLSNWFEYGEYVTLEYDTETYKMITIKYKT
jgi:hypothetical protein